MSPKPEALEGVRVLVVEDETLIAEEIKERLVRLGLCVVENVDTGAGAVQAAQRHRPDLILMDIRLKGPMDGIRAADAIRQFVQAPVVFLTAHSDQETLRNAKGVEPFGFVLKPFHERELIVAMEMALNRHTLQQRLKESERRYAATLASIGDAVIATDRDGLVTFMNPVAEALTEWRLTEAVGQAVNQVFAVRAEATGVACENPALEAMRLKRTVQWTEPAVLMARGRTLIPIDDSAAPIIGEEGQLEGAVVAFRDVRQRRLAEEALKHAQEQVRQSQKIEGLGRLAGGVAHDFNNLLTVINGCSELLLSGEALDTTMRSLLSDIKKAGERAAGLTRQLLAFSRNQVMEPTVLHLGQLVADITRMLERLIGEDVLLTATSGSELWSIRADPGQIEQVILNLAVNARDAMPQGGRLTIETRNLDIAESVRQTRPEMQPGPYVMLAVSDTGVGMDAATQERAFEPFFTTKQLGQGTGLGLSTVYGIVKQSGGFVYLYSELGKGTTFKIYFPALLEAARPPAPTKTGPGPRGHETILVVEDEESVRELTASVLRRHGYNVMAAGSGAIALQLLAEHSNAIQLVVTDVVMPKVSGRDVADKARSLNPQVRVLFLSGYTDDTVVRHGVLAGEFAFLAKPFTMRALTQKVREVLDRPAEQAKT